MTSVLVYGGVGGHVACGIDIGFLLSFLFDPEDGGEMFLRSIR
jgi:hypothetical protein